MAGDGGGGRQPGSAERGPAAPPVGVVVGTPRGEGGGGRHSCCIC